MTEQKRLLIIEDDPGARTLLEIFIGNTGLFAITFARDLAAAEVALNEQVFDGIVSDHNLPDGKGLDLIKRVVQSDRHSTTPIWLFTDDRLAMEAADRAQIASVEKGSPRTLLEAVKNKLLGQG